MFSRLLAVALGAGILSGALITLVQGVTTIPLILEAESYEGGSASALAGLQPATSIVGEDAAGVRLAHGGHAHPGEDGHVHPDEDGSAWMPAEGLERNLFTLLSNIVTGTAFALLLAAAFGLSRARVDARRGVVWGVAGFAAFAAAPALGLPPETPGMVAGDLGARQAWWLLAAACTAAGLWLLVFRRAVWMHAAGAGLIALPHLLGAPGGGHGGGHGGVPAELAAQFVTASLVTSLLFWTMLGWLAGRFYERALRA